MGMNGKTTYQVDIKIVGEINDTEKTDSEVAEAADHALEFFFCNVRGHSEGWITVQHEIHKEVPAHLETIRKGAIP